MQQREPDWKVKQFALMDQNEQYLATSNIIRVSSNMNALYQDCAARAVNVLIMINSGGARWWTPLSRQFFSKI